MIIHNVLLALDAGLGDGETPIFPIHIFKVKEGINYNPGDPNYDLFELACKVSAKRLFPNFEFIDAPFNLQYYKPGHPETEVATMGCVQGDEVVTYRVDEKLYVESFKRFWSRMIELFGECKISGKSEYIDTSSRVEIFDTTKDGFVKCKKIIRNPNMNNWVKIKFDNGRILTCTDDHPLPVINNNNESVRTFVKDIVVGDKVPVTYKQYSEETTHVETDIAWLLGMLLRESSYEPDKGITVTVGLDVSEGTVSDISNKLTIIVNENWDAWTTLNTVKVQDRDCYTMQIRTGSGDVNDQRLTELCNYLHDQFNGWTKHERQLPTGCFSWNKEARYALLAGLIDADGLCVVDSIGKCRVMLGSINKELTLQEMMLVQSLGMVCQLNEYIYETNGDKEFIFYQIRFDMDEELNKYIVSSKKNLINENDEEETFMMKMNVSDTCEVVSIENISIDEYSFDVETESDRFDVSGILSHNCRTRVIGNNFDKNNEVVTGRGNLSFTTINLPRLAIEAEGDIDKFFDSLDKMMDASMDQLLDRFEIQASKHVYNYPFLMGEGVWKGSENLKPEDEVREVIKHGTLSVGFIGLAETLISLIGEHHGESERAQELGLKIIKFMREKTDAKAKETKLNFSLLATPAEGLCLAGDTLVQTPYGNKPIKDIKEGDEVFSYNLDTHEVEIDVVAKSQMTSPSRKVMKITFDTGQEVICTPNHPFAVRRIHRDEYGRIMRIDGFTESVEFVNAEDLKVGDRIKSNYIELSNHKFKNNDFIHIVTNTEYLEDEIPVYDITMTNNSNFFVGGDRGILVHNSGRFVKLDAKKYGIIKGVTDKDYYTNSFHLPVYFNISAFNKIKLEAPYHELTNAGHISYIELDGDPTQNIPAFIQIIRCMKENGIGYGAINHPVDRDPECGYTGIINDVCPKCGRRESEHGGCEFQRIRRITGYLTNLKRANNAKTAEIADRVKHD